MVFFCSIRKQCYEFSGGIYTTLVRFSIQSIEIATFILYLSLSLDVADRCTEAHFQKQTAEERQQKKNI